MDKYDAKEIYLHEITINQQLSLNTIETYTYQLTNYFNYLDEYDINDLNDINNEVILNYINKMSENKSEASISHSISIIRGFHQFISMNYPKIINPILKIKNKNKHTNLPQLIKESDLKTIFNSFSESEKDILNNALFEFLYSCGLRVSELTNLSINDINFENKIIKVKGKGSKERIVPISDVAIDKYYVYSKLRKEYNTKKSTYLFINKLGNQITRQYIWQELKLILDSNNIKTDYSPHSFRHTYATSLLEGGANLRYVQELLGHSDISTTQIYVHLQKSKLQKDYDQYFLRGRKERKNHE